MILRNQGNVAATLDSGVTKLVAIHATLDAKIALMDVTPPAMVRRFH
jgi:hypothetical protein